VLNVKFDVALYRPSDNASSHNHAERGGYYVRFRLANEGNGSINCPVHPGTNVLLGYVVHRTTAQSGWVALPSSNSVDSFAQQCIDQNPALIEMPPGGLLDGRFYDPGWPDDDHAYAVDLRPAPNETVIQFVSRPYHRGPEAH
jgi:hypothetical protein